VCGCSVTQRRRRGCRAIVRRVCVCVGGVFVCERVFLSLMHANVPTGDIGAPIGVCTGEGNTAASAIIAEILGRPGGLHT